MVEGYSLGKGFFRIILAGFTLALTGCGAGIVGLILGLKSSGGGSGTGPVTVVSAVGITHTRSSPATINFVLTDSQSRPADVEVTYSMAAGSPNDRVIVRLKDQKSSPTGFSNSCSWEFGPTLGTGLVRGVTVRAALPDGSSAALAGLVLGNDRPKVANVQVPSGKVAGIVDVEFTVSDSSDDLVEILVEYRAAGAPVPWKKATPKGASQLEGVQARSTGTILDFFWDAQHDLGNTEQAVEIQVSAFDGLSWSQPASAPDASLIVNNNQRPVATIFAEDFASNPDRRRGIPLPFMIQDDDGDEVRVVFQWRLAGQSFPDLPADRTGIEEILADPAKWREFRIASEFPMKFEGRLALVGPQGASDDRKVRLPEVASTASPLMTRGLAGLELEILRNSQVPRPWGRSTDLNGPVGVVPLADGIRGLVLDREGAGAFRLRELDLGSGKVARTIVPSGEGEPAALCLEPGETHALVATNLGGRARVSRVDLATGVVALLADVGPSPARGLAALGSGAALMTAGDSLVRVSYGGSGGARAATVLGGLKTPWGIAVDLHDPSKAYLAERDGGDAGGPGCVLVLDLNTLARRTLSVTGSALGHPGALAINLTGLRLLVATGAGDAGARALVEVDLTAGAKGDAAALVPSLPGDVAGIYAGPDMLLALALPASNDLFLGGGVEQRRRIEAYTPKGTEATVDAAFDPPLRGFEPWRIHPHLGSLQATQNGQRGFFIWDSSDAPQTGGVVLRAVPYDSEMGLADESGASRPHQGIFPETPVLLGDPDSTRLTQAVTLEDLNGDGFRDVIEADIGGLSVFLQGDPGKFPAQASWRLKGPLGARSVVAADLDGDGFSDLVATNSLGSGVALFFGKEGGPSGDQPDLELKGPREPRQVAVADLDRDGFLDLVVASAVESKVVIFRQTSPRTFVARSEGVLGGPDLTKEPTAVAVGDLNGDGFPDIASANESGNDLTVFFQSAKGTFSGSPDLRLSSPQTQAPQALAAEDWTATVGWTWSPPARIRGASRSFTRRERQGGSARSRQSLVAFRSHDL
jgi:hypothetical protein